MSDRDLPLPRMGLENLLSRAGRDIDQLSLRATWPGSVRDEHVRYALGLDVPLQLLDLTQTPNRDLATVALSFDLDPGRWVIIAGIQVIFYFQESTIGRSGIIVTAGSSEEEQGNVKFGGPLEFIEPSTYQLALAVVEDEAIRVTVRAYAGDDVVSMGGSPTANSWIKSAWALAFPG